MYRILIVEDDTVLAAGLVMALKKEGYIAEECHRLKKAGKILNSCSYDMVILDVNLPDGDGAAFCMEFKQKSVTPVIMLTACDTDKDEIRGLGAGADDYITKPFNLDVLKARIKAVSRRKNGLKRYQSGRFIFDFEGHQFFAGNAEVKLSRAEQELLYLFVKNPLKVLERDSIIMKVWDNEESVDENTLTVTVGRLRGKLGSSCIETVYGIGYRWKGTD